MRDFPFALFGLVILKMTLWNGDVGPVGEQSRVCIYIYIPWKATTMKKKVIFLDDDKPLRPIKHGD